MFLIILAAFFSSSDVVSAANEVGTVIALRGKAVIHRDKKDIHARLRDGLLLPDAVSTLEASRAKMLFRDDSVLTMGEKSSVLIKEFLSAGEKKGRSIFNLVDGKMKAVVGGGQFEVHTPTAVAAARGTVIYFSVETVKGRQCTTIFPSEGTVIAKSTSKKIKGSITLTRDLVATICLGEPLPKPVAISPMEKESLIKDTDITGYEISMPVPAGTGVGAGAAVSTVGTPPVNQQPITISGAAPPPPPPPPPSPVTSPSSGGHVYYGLPHYD